MISPSLTGYELQLHEFSSLIHIAATTIWSLRLPRIQHPEISHQFHSRIHLKHNKLQVTANEKKKITSLRLSESSLPFLLWALALSLGKPEAPKLLPEPPDDDVPAPSWVLDRRGAPAAMPRRRPGSAAPPSPDVVAAAEGRTDVAGPARPDAAPHRRPRRRGASPAAERGETRPRRRGRRERVAGDAAPELRVEVLLQRVVEGVREPRGGLRVVAGEHAGALAAAGGGDDPRLRRLRLRHDAAVVP